MIDRVDTTRCTSTKKALVTRGPFRRSPASLDGSTGGGSLVPPASSSPRNACNGATPLRWALRSGVGGTARSQRALPPLRAGPTHPRLPEDHRRLRRGEETCRRSEIRVRIGCVFGLGASPCIALPRPAKDADERNSCRLALWIDALGLAVRRRRAQVSLG